MSRAATSLIPPKLYKHFAIVTISLTALLAMFADGEGSNELVKPAAREFDQRQANARDGLRENLAAAPVDGGFRSALDEVQGDNGFSPDTAFGKPTERPSGAGGYVPAEVAAANFYSEEYLASLSEEERALLLAGLREARMLDEDEKLRQIAALDHASAVRSGAKPGQD